MIVRSVFVPAALVLSASAGLAQHTHPADAEPKGWIGVWIQNQEDNYPVLSAVAPESPAEAAGLLVGDTILKYDNVDARTTRGVKPFLQPGRRLRVTVRRNGVRRIVTVVIGKNKALDSEWSSWSSQPNDDSALATATITTTTTVPASILFPLLEFSTAAFETNIIAGVSLARMSADLAEVLHTRSDGVFVINVAPKTTAKRAGLRGGDVIVMVDTVRVDTPIAIAQVMSLKTAKDSGDRTVTLAVVRDGKTRRIKLRR